MPLFEFDDNNGNPTGANSLNFSEDTVPFTISTSGTSGNQVTQSHGTPPDGNLSISDQGTTFAAWTFDINSSHALTNFAAAGISLVLGPSFSGTWNVTFIGTAGDVMAAQSVVAGATLTPGAHASTVFTGIRFTPTSTGFLQIDSLNATLVCYCAGTAIATPAGVTAVEDLRPGDTLLTADGGETRVKWLGAQPVDTRRTHPATVNPIRIAAGALADGLPARDLLVSPDHAIAIDGLLFQASTLVNGRSIRREATMPAEGFTYYHVETEAHELILAEGCPAESFVDVAGLDNFVNGAERAGPAIAEMDLPRIADRRLVPQALQERLAARADLLADLLDDLLDGAQTRAA